MGKADYFKHGTYNAICDQCGFKFKADQLQMTWDGFFVCDKCYEPRHPQDFVRGKLDKQRVPIARPDPDIKYNQTTLSAAASKGAKSLNIGSITYTTQYVSILIELDDSSFFVTRIAETPLVSTNVLIEDALPFDAASGNKIYIMNHTEYLSPNEVTTDDL